ncbi:MAG: DUF72 domain-containing protein [Flavobacteriales bacterium]|nr:DUF72 domain-containing protein [Flavobacteriales bacterium]
MKFGYLENVDGIDFHLPKDDSRTTKLLAGLSPSKKTNLYIGGPVFSDKSFVGTVYPAITKQKDFLSAYSQSFNCIEVNSTRFGVPSLSTQESWINKVGDNFKFSFKMPQVITHRKNMNDMGGQVQTDKFLQCLDKFGEKAGMTYMLLPNYFKMERWPMIKQFLLTYPTDLPLAIEARNVEFHESEEVYDFLQERNISLCITDVPGRRDVLHQTLVTDTVFIRFGGANLHHSDYVRIDAWVEKIVFWISKGIKNIYFYIHQPAPNKYKFGLLANYLKEQLHEKIHLKN